MTLLNWPPSRGPMPDWMQNGPEYIIPEVKRQIIKKKIVQCEEDCTNPLAELEKALIEGNVVVGGVVIPSVDFRQKDIGPSYECMKELAECEVKDLNESIKEKIEERKREQKYVDINVHMNINIEAYSTLTLRQATLITNCYAERTEENKRYVWARKGSELGQIDDLPQLPYIVEINYPLSNIVDITVEPYQTVITHRDGIKSTPRDRMEVSYFLWVVAQEYKRIYENHEEFGIWGHSFGDLFFEGVHFRVDGTAALYIGS